MSRFSYPHISVNSTLRDMRYASMESCFQGLSFIYLHLRPLNNLWGLYDPKTENMTGFLPVMEQFRHIELSAMPILKDLNEVFICFSYTHEPWAVFQISPDIEHSRQWTLVCITVILILKGLWRPVTDKYLESVWPLGCANTMSFSGQITILHHV